MPSPVMLLLIVVGWVMMSIVGILGRGRVVVLLRLASLTVVLGRLLGVRVRRREEGGVYWACCAAGCHRGRGGRWGVGPDGERGRDTSTRVPPQVGELTSDTDLRSTQPWQPQQSSTSSSE